MNNPNSEYRKTPESWERPQEPAASGSVPHLLRLLTSEVTTLFSKEVSLARAEVREAVNGVKTGLVSMVTGGVVLLAGLIILLWSAVYGLANFMDLWLAALIVGGVVALIGFSMVNAGKHKLDADALKPRRTVESIKEDRAVFKHAVKGGH